MTSATLSNTEGSVLDPPNTSRGRSTPEPVASAVPGVVVTTPVKKHPEQSQTLRGEKFVSDTTALFGESSATESKSISLPFSRAAISPHVDLSKCTWAQLGWESAASRAIREGSITSKESPIKWESTSGYNARTWARRFPGWPEDDENSDSEVSDCDRRRRDRDRDRCDDEAPESEDDAEDLHSTLSLGLGLHRTTFKDRPVYVLLQRNGGANEFEWIRDGWKKNQEIFVFVEGVGETDFLQDFLEAMIMLIPMTIPPRPRPREFSIYRWDHCNGYWRKRQTQQARKMESVILPEGLIDKVQDDMKEFLAEDTAEWYKTFGIPYKRSYLFHGVPGSGKTSTICALAGLLKRNVCFLAAHHPSFSDDTMKNAMERLPKKSFLIMEDIDSLFVKRTSCSKNSSLTFTGLLNCLDGIGHAQGQIVVMTTNYVDRLDEALIRAGRADMWVEFKKATDFQLAGLFKWFYHKTPEEAEKWAPTFVEGCRKQFPKGITMCEMQQHFVDHRTSSAETCAKGVDKYDMPLRKFQHLKKLDFESDEGSASAARRRQRKKRSDRSREDSPESSS